MDEQNASVPFIRNPKDLKIPDLLPDRPTLGNEVSIVLWRLIRLVGFYDILGDETDSVAYFTGKKIGKLLEVKSMDELRAKLADFKIGKLDFETDGDNLVRVSIGECFTCAGIKPPLGRPVCHLEAGVMAGALESIYEGKSVFAKETKCMGGLGDDACVVECQII